MKILDIIDILLKIFLITLGLFILYQLILKIFGGSWETESIIIALLTANIGLTFALAVNQARMSAELGYLKQQFRCLANNFKLHCKNK